MVRDCFSIRFQVGETLESFQVIIPNSRVETEIGNKKTSVMKPMLFKKNFLSNLLSVTERTVFENMDQFIPVEYRSRL